MTKKTKQLLWKWTKRIGKFVLTIPAIISVIGILGFGFSRNNEVLMPLLKPFIECKNSKLDGSEGGYSLYKISITVTRPIYLKVTRNYFSMPYNLNLAGASGFTFFEVGSLESADGLQFVERRFSSSAHIAKSVHFFHRFLESTGYQFDVNVSGPIALKEDECPFTYSVSF